MKMLCPGAMRHGPFENFLEGYSQFRDKDYGYKTNKPTTGSFPYVITNASDDPKGNHWNLVGFVVQNSELSAKVYVWDSLLPAVARGL